MSEQIERYNGWANRATWCVNLWLSNEEGSYTYWRDAAAHILDVDENGTPDEQAEQRTEAREHLAERLESELREQSESALPQGASLWSDLVGDPLREVDWEEVAGAFLDE